MNWTQKDGKKKYTQYNTGNSQNTRNKSRKKRSIIVALEWVLHSGATTLWQLHSINNYFQSKEQLPPFPRQIATPMRIINVRSATQSMKT